MFTGLEFYDQLDSVCKKNGTTVSAFLLSIGKQKSLGSSMKKAQTPNHQVALAASKQFGVPLSLLLGTENELPSLASDITLSEEEINLILGLRSSEPIIRDTVLRMVSAAIDKKSASSSFVDGNSYHAKSKTPIKTRKFLKPVEGEAAAGAPITAVAGEAGSVSVPEKYLDERYFIVRARGESMEETIPNGACCVFQRDAFADDGVIALVQIEGATDQPDDTIKRIYRRGQQIELRSDNPRFAPMLYPAESVQLAGILVAVLPLD